MRSPPPSLLSLTVNAAVLNISRINDLSHLPDHIVLDLFAVKPLISILGLILALGFRI
jgi:hypothetical protein